MRDEQLIAHLREKDKVPQLLSEHLLGVSRISGQIARKIGLEKFGSLAGLLHDVGKASDEFQQYIKSATGMINPDADDYINPLVKKGKIDHSTSGAQFIHGMFGFESDEIKIVGQILSLCIASHHSGLIDCISPDGEDKFSARMGKDEELSHSKESFSKLPSEVQNKIQSMIADQQLVEQVIQKLKEIREHNDSHDTLYFKWGLLIRFLFSALIDADRLDTADFELPANLMIRNYGKYSPWSELINKMDKQVKQFQEKENKNNIDNLRNQISETCNQFSKKPKGIFQLSVPTGGGKTISSLRFALNHAAEHELDRIFYIIPYTSIIDQNADEVRKILEEKDEAGNYLNQFVLEHHSNLTPDEENYKQKLLSENWDAPIVFTTQVQFLESLFASGTKSTRRMHQLANSVIIFDEIQTLPIRCVHMFNVAIRFLVKLCGASVVLCTATQPLLHLVDPPSKALPVEADLKIIENEGELYEAFKRVEVIDNRKIGGWSDDEVSDLVFGELDNTGSVLVIVNTKNSARHLFNILKGKNCPGLYHLSTSMCPAHRLSTLAEIRTKLNTQNKPVVCVSTQLIEAGVDVDFGSVIRYLAGLDSITQAAGRCNRNNLRENGFVHIINPAEENIQKIKDISAGASICERILDEFKGNPLGFDGDIISLKLLEQYYKYYFYQRSSEMGYQVGVNSVIGREETLFSLLSDNIVSLEAYKRIHKKEPQISFRHSFQSANKSFQAIESSTRGIIVPYNEGEEIISQLISSSMIQVQFSLLKKAQKYSVNLWSNEFKKMFDAQAIHEIQKGAGIFYLRKEYYSEDTGLNFESIIDSETLII